jgi:hypothetical protein
MNHKKKRKMSKIINHLNLKINPQEDQKVKLKTMNTPPSQEQILEDFADYLGERKLELDKREKMIVHKEKILKEKEDNYLKLTIK